MSDPLVYDSRSVRFKSPYGAVPSGTQVTFTLRPLRSEGYSRGRLTARLEQRDNQIITVELPWTDTELGGASRRPDTGDYVGLVWYTFQLETSHRSALEHKGGVPAYRLRRERDRAPLVRGRGGSYQIFPDRFRRTRVPDPAGLVGGAHCPPELAGGAGVPTRRQRGDPQPGLLRGRPEGRDRGAGLPPVPGGGDAVLQPHLRSGGEPPLRHR